MDRLILLRHGRAERMAESGRDFDRALEPRGRAEAHGVAARLAEAGMKPDLVLVSPAKRTRETWDVMEDLFPAARLEVEQRLYNADTALIADLAQAAEGATVMVVGHNPGLQDLTCRLLREASAAPSLIARAESQFPPAAASVFLIGPEGDVAYDGLFLPQHQDAG